MTIFVKLVKIILIIVYLVKGLIEIKVSYLLVLAYKDTMMMDLIQIVYVYFKTIYKYKFINIGMYLNICYKY